MKGIIINLVLNSIVSLYLYPWFVTVLMKYTAILTTIAILLLKYLDARAGTSNTGHFGEIHLNILLLLGRKFSGIIRQEPLDFLIPVIPDGLDKVG